MNANLILAIGIASALNSLLWASVALALALFIIGYVVGGRAQDRRRAGTTIVQAALLLAAVVIFGTVSAAAKTGTEGSFVLTLGMLVAFLLALGLLGGFLAGSQRKSGRTAGMAAVGGVVCLLGILDLAFAYSRIRPIVGAVKEFGLDAQKYEPEKNKDCPENLKSLYTAFRMYAEDWSGLPPAERWEDNEELISKVHQNEWLHCPAVSNRHDDKYGYAYNTQVAGVKLNGQALKEMPNAAVTPLLYDSTDLAKSAHDAVTSLPKPGRHGGRNNILYCDGHVEAVAPR